MEKLNEYLQELLSTCGYELHLEPNKQPVIISDKGETELAGAPLLGTQISMLIFPLIPASVKQELPNKSEVEFTHSNGIGNFNFHVKKSPAGFNATIRPLLSEGKSDAAIHESNAPTLQSTENSSPVFAASEPRDFDSFSPVPMISSVSSAPSQASVSNVQPTTSAQNYSFGESAAAPFAGNQIDYSSPDIEIESFQTEYQRKIFDDAQPATIRATAAPETVPPSEPQLSTNFSDVGVYEPHQSSLPQVVFTATIANPQARQRMDALFRQMADVGASDLHLSATMPPLVRRDGKMQKLESDEGTLAPEQTKELLSAIMPAKNQEEFALRRDTDFAYEIENLARFRANIFMDRKGMGGVFRIIPSKILTAEELGLSKAIMDLCELSKGLVVVTGPTGSGKSTTLCAMIDSINKRREDHIITIEDPIEFTHENQKCLVNQREVHNHTDSFKDALRAALREDPDILLVGEMRDLETISIAIETAETGHLVFGTLHTTTAASTVDRIIDQFPADRQQQIRVMLSESLKGVIAQTLLPKKGGGRVAALEVLIVTPAISNLIREGKTFQIPSAMQTGKTHGMAMLNDSLFDLVNKGLVEPRDAYVKAVDKTNFEALLNRNGMKI
jgi:twitching motility protein PilT